MAPSRRKQPKPKGNHSAFVAGELRELARLRSQRVAPRAGPKRSKQSKRSGPKLRAGAGQTNEYLSSVLNPWQPATTGVPDNETVPSSKVHSNHRIQLSSDANGNCMMSFMPTVAAGGLWHGVNALGAACAVATGSTDLGALMNAPYLRGSAGAVGAVAFDVVSSAVRNTLSDDFTDVRPISMGLKFDCSSALTTMTGVCSTLLIPAFACPRGTTTGLTNIPGGATALPIGESGQVLANITQVSDAPESQTTSAIREFATIWKPEIPNSIPYVATPAAAVTGTQNYLYSNTECSAGFTANVWPAATVGANTLLLPGGAYWDDLTLSGLLAPAANAPVSQTFPNRLPIVVIAWTGLPANTSFGSLVITISFEAIPIPQKAGVIPTTPSLSVPDELAHTSNILQPLPITSYPTVPDEPGTRVLTHARAAAPSSLYAGGSATKANVSGSTFWSSLRRVASSALTAVSPLLAKIPGIGIPLSAGAALLGEIARD